LFGSVFGSRSDTPAASRQKEPWVGFASPEEALSALEQAYRDGDVDAAVRAKNFAYEGAAMIQKIGGISDPDLAVQAAEVLELSYRKHARDDGLPDLTALRLRSVPRPRWN
jgi:hypothetical protein